MTSHTAQRLAAFAVNLAFDDLPDEVVAQAIRIIRDTCGTMLAGSTLPEVANLSRNAHALGGAGGCTVMGHHESTTAHIAALINGTGGVSLELDEGSQWAINHPAVHIFPAAFAIAESQRATGKDLLTAFVAGYEVAVRVGRATRLRQPVHPFGTHAIVGAAAAVSKLLGHDAQQTAQALELAAGMTIASSQTAANSGASVRNLFTGLTNHNGILAALLVTMGFTGQPNALDVVYGQILGESFVVADLLDDLGSDYFILRNYFKLYACSRWNHAPIEATAALLEQAPFTAEDVASITVWTYSPATRLTSRAVPNGYAGKHSILYNVAARIIYGANDMTVYTDEHVRDRRVQALMGRIAVEEDPALTAMLPDVRPARVEVALNTGEIINATVERPRGGFDNPLRDDELVEKFRQLAGMALSKDHVDALIDLLPQLPQMESLEPISTQLRGQQR